MLKIDRTGPLYLSSRTYIIHDVTREWTSLTQYDQKMDFTRQYLQTATKTTRIFNQSS